uniref:Perm-5 n=1 Tax=Pristionchus pacificus TaxID=54126 RepID=A0A2A6CK11_PRIPA|eukprot:PDM78565.1 perm-5 [Pristionchus pacificus]
MLLLLLPPLIFPLAGGSQLSAILGDAAASQLLRHAAKITLAEPRYVEVLLKTAEEPTFGPLARIDLANRIGYRNLSLHFHRDEVHVMVDEFSLLTSANLTNLMWPLGLDDQAIELDVQLPRGEVRVLLDQSSFSLERCNLSSPSLSAGASNHWLADAGASFMGYLLSPALDSALCGILAEHLAQLNHTNVMKFPVESLLPPKARKFLAQEQTALFYRLQRIDVDTHQLRVLVQIEWNKRINSDESVEMMTDANSTVFDMELRGDDMITVWIEDGILNELISQESIPLSSPVIPPDSRDFLSTLCSQCYFLVNVTAKGQPTIQATNSSFVLEKRDNVNLRVVNPDKNVTSVFVAFTLTINAEIRPSFDNGILRTLVQLQDTSIEMEKGAFPKNWALFMQDLMRGMILDMMWPEIKNAIEELSYGKGVRISPACGLDPSKLSLEILEGSFAVTTKLDLNRLELDRCVKEMKSSLPNPSKLLNGQKMKAVILTVVCAVASTASIGDMYGALNSTMTLEMAKHCKSIFMAFDDCFTPALSSVAKKITDADLQAMVDLHNKMISGEVATPTTRAEVLSCVKQHVPALYAGLVAANTDFEARFAKLSAADKEMINQLESGSFNVMKTRSQSGAVDFYLGVCAKYQALPTAAHDDFKAAFPESVKCLDDGLYKQTCSLAEALKANNYKMDTKIMALVSPILQNKRFSVQH